MAHGTCQEADVAVVHGPLSTPPSGPEPVMASPTTTRPAGTSTVTAAQVAPGTDWPGQTSRCPPAATLTVRSTARPVSSATVTRPSVSFGSWLIRVTTRPAIPSRSAVGPRQNHRSPAVPLVDTSAGAVGSSTPTPRGTLSAANRATPTARAPSTTIAGARDAFTGPPGRVGPEPSWRPARQ